MEPKLNVEYMDVGELIPYANNAKEHPDWQVEQIAASIRQFGMCDPVGVWTNPDGGLEIVEGHGRVLALKEMGVTRCPVIKLDHLDDEGRRAYTHIHNQTNLTTGFDWEALDAEIAQMPEIDWGAFGFNSDALRSFELQERAETRQGAVEIGLDQFDAENFEHECPRCGFHYNGDLDECPRCHFAPNESDEYNEFTEKFLPKKTTDDCYTPDLVYEAIAGWVENEYRVDRSTFVRPFYPGGDYERESYPDGCVVVDNPPFSILSEITRFYVAKSVPFFIFAPTLTLCSTRVDGVTFVAAGCDITYANGAKVNTSFITNMQPSTVLRSAPSLTQAVADAMSEINQSKPILIKYNYPKHVVTSAIVSNWSEAGVEFEVPAVSGEKVYALDAQKEFGKVIYGGGFLLSDGLAAEAAEAAKAVKAAKAAKAVGVHNADIDDDGRIVWRLSDREREIIARLK